MSKIDEFKEYARKKIADKLRESENTKEESVDASTIKPYNGEDAFYSGSDEEYKEFLDGLDIDMNDDEMGSTQKFNLNDFVNVKDVVGKVKETAAKVTEKATDITSNIKDKVNEVADIQGNINEVNESVVKLNDSLENISAKLSDMSGINSLNNEALKNDIDELKKITEQIRNGLDGVSKLNDSVFDMKNSQQNTKNSVSDLQNAFMQLKKKTITGIVILSIIGLIVVVMEVINLLA